MISTPLDQFERALQTLRELHQIGSLRLRLNVSAYARAIEFDFSPTSAEAAEFRTDPSLIDVTWDIGDVLAAVVTGIDRDEFARVRTDPERWGTDEETEPENPDVARRKFDLVTSAFDIGELRRRQWVKLTSKERLITDLEWEVVTKVADHDGPPPDEASVPFATLKLRLDEPTDAYSYYAATPPRSVVFSADEADIDLLVERLTHVRDVLSERQRESARNE